MKTPLTYGAIVAFAATLLSLFSHILGFSTDAEKMMWGMAIGLVGMLAILISGIIAGTRAARTAQGPAAGFTYGKAFSTGFLIILVAALLLAAYNYIYYSFIFSNFADVQIEWTRSFMERMNAPAAKVEQVLEDTRAKATVFHQVRRGFVFILCLGSIISLITAAVMKRPPADDLSAPPVGS